MPVELLKRFAGSTTIESVAIEFVKPRSRRSRSVPVTMSCRMP